MSYHEPHRVIVSSPQKFTSTPTFTAGAFARDITVSIDDVAAGSARLRMTIPEAKQALAALKAAIAEAESPECAAARVA